MEKIPEGNSGHVIFIEYKSNPEFLISLDNCVFFFLYLFGKNINQIIDC
jgi:hypothetical protein